ncbi:MAG: sulfotransferase [Halofilum sp. (in: g-proteobacteria)]
MKVAEVTLEEALRQARLHQQEGNLIVAERVYRDVLEADSEQLDALREIGIVSYLRGKPQEAYSWFRKARAAEPENAVVQSNFAVMAAQTGAIEEAIASWRSAIALAPDYVDAYSNLVRVLVEQGETDEAIRLCEAGQQHSPSHVDLRTNYGFALEAKGDLAKAVEIWEGVLDQTPDHPAVLANLANAYRDLGRTAEATAMGERATAADPNNAPAHINLGNAYLDQGDPEAAERMYARATQCDPRNCDAYDNLGAVLLQRGCPEEAAQWHRIALAIDQTRAKSHAYLSVALRSIGAFADAEAAAQQALGLAPDSVEYQVNLADLLLAVDRPDEAEAVLNDALEAEPESVSARLKFARALERLDRFEEAEEQTREAAERMPESPWPPLTLAQIRLMAGDSEGGRMAAERALELVPDFVPALIWLGEYNVTMGELDRAVGWARRALELNSDAIGAYGIIANARRFERDDPDLAAMEAAYAEPKHQQAVGLGFALGKALDAAGEQERAFSHYLNANASRRRAFHYGKGAAESRLARIRENWSAARLAELTEYGDPSDVPVFIVGMPRSGTTLLEQILSSHPMVHGAGELTTFGRVLRQYGPIDDDTAGPLGRAYVETVRGLAPEAARITDKMPGNYQHIGAIAAALPNAVIIHARRDPEDTCLSCFQQSFARGQHWSYDLEEVAHQYRIYQGIMQHWRAVLGDRLAEIDYEDVVADVEREARRLIAAVGLDWDPNCLEFYQAPRAVLTASKGQVRRPIYSSSVSKSERYGERVQPLRDALEHYRTLALG